MGKGEYVLLKTNRIMCRVPGDEIIGVEVGVFGAQLSGVLLEMHSRLKKLYGIDPYKATPGHAWTQEKWDALYTDVQRVMKMFGSRWELLREESLRVVDMLPDQLDFVYLDGDHSEEVVSREIRVYEKKIRSGGLLCGHDYGNETVPGVKQAVDAHARQSGRPAHFDKSVNMWWRNVL